MQTRPYPEKDGLRIWLSRSEQRALVESSESDPRRRLVFQLGLHGLRTDEIIGVQPRHVRELSNEAEGHVLVVPDGKTGKREVPISDDLAQHIWYFKSVGKMRQDERIIEVSKRSLRNWIAAVREELEDERAAMLGMHDLRRTWATDTYYSLAFAGVPIAEQLVMSWGGWKQTSAGRETFRENYLGPVPDHITGEARLSLDLI